MSSSMLLSVILVPIFDMKSAWFFCALPVLSRSQPSLQNGYSLIIQEQNTIGSLLLEFERYLAFVEIDIVYIQAS